MSTEITATSSNLVSIICRTIGREELCQALDSIAEQTYGNIEIVLVNSAQQNLSAFDPERYQAVVVNPEKPLTRTQAANAGLESANGTYLMFLDDDDWIAENHVEILLTAIENNNECKAVYSSTVKTEVDGTATQYVFDTDYDSLLLMRDNYIPIHSVLFSSELVERGCHFDESFDIYEDWDFWLQISQYTDFIHINEQTAFYRAGGDSDTATDDDSLRFKPEHPLGKARAQLFNKWKNKWDGDAVNQMLGNVMRLDLSEKVDEVARRLDEEIRKGSLLDNQVTDLNQKLVERETAVQDKNEKLLKLETVIQDKETVIQDKNEKIYQIQSKLEAVIQDRDEKLYQMQSKLNEIENTLKHKSDIEKHLNIHVQQLETELYRVLSSATWRVMGPVRRLGRIFSGSASTENKQSEISENSEDAREVAESTPNPEIPAKESEKSAYDKKAMKALEEFLASDGRLDFANENTPSISIVIVFYNQAHLSLLCLRSLLEHNDVPIELIIVDNASSDETGKLLAKIDDASIIRNDENLGFIKAVNQGVEASQSDYILLLNNDAVVHQHALSSALRSISNDASVGAVGGKIVLTDGSLQEAGCIIWQDGSCLGYGRGDDPSFSAYMFERDVDYCSGAFLLFRRSDFEELGGFDLDYAPAYYEESDFCIRLHKKGLRIVYNPLARITHYEFASSGGISGASALQKEHQAILCDKHGDWLGNQFFNDPKAIPSARTANRYPNVLVIDDRVPHPSLGSGYPRAAHLLKTLNMLDLNITFYPLQFPMDDWSEIYSSLDKEIEVILEKGCLGLHSFLESRKGFFQYIIVSRIHNMSIFKELMVANENLLGNAKVIYDAEALTASREIKQKKLNQQLISEQEQADLLANEIEKASAADIVIAVSKKESETYREHGIENVRVLGHTLRPSRGNKEFSDREGILFVGALRDEGSPNVDSILWFIVNVLPLVEKEIRNVNLYIVGDKGAQSLASIEKTNVSFLGRLENLQEIYNNSRIFIAPTRFAAGIPHKVHEATAMGIPSVTTPLLAEQLDWRHEKELLVGETPECFAKQCVRLYQDESLWRSVQDAGLEAITKDCSPEQFQQELESLFD
ncbi:MAG: glycosyltransferase [Pseudomonadota bacterium]|nr:glycosyltransferase [Pseudomonadota bacterium]